MLIIIRSFSSFWDSGSYFSFFLSFSKCNANPFLIIVKMKSVKHELGSQYNFFELLFCYYCFSFFFSGDHEQMTKKKKCSHYDADADVSLDLFCLS